jgi:hypothetical protein
MVVQKAAEDLARVLSAVPSLVGPGLREVATVGEIRVQIAAWPAAQSAPAVEARPLTPCEQDCLALLRREGRSRTAKQVHRALEEAGRLYGFGTVQKALTALKGLGYARPVGGRQGYEPAGGTGQAA